ncbi:unnamed protein product [Rotaria sp. Silwood1]|nr:unnamed protein product [Rotaria sp. Silwood1]CAF1562645.1 unnamed protein product [Rotaria sp. Silwood1]CAF1563053.1 unnamed protein product [Rotaria sp. Silwood1]CAF3652262.1 unnamed protein product [Rotaria sp. Silwood1]CAF3737424.1 unnamed protein product [Rotaria sp. Silwood1]
MAEAKNQTKTVSRRKMALVIGNSDYEYLKKLKNPSNDADAMESTLKRIGFTVTKKKNATYDEMEDSITNFKRKIDKGDMVLFYFSGHGVQWEVRIQGFTNMN